MSMLFIGKDGDAWCDKAREFAARHFEGFEYVSGKRCDPTPGEFSTWRGDYVISYLSQWIIPAELLSRAEIAAINFHPGPPEYPGIGCTNFAIYNQEKVFGVTCHHMAPKVDTGKIIAVRRFPLLESDSVYTLTQRCYENIFALFMEVMSGISEGKPLPESSETWVREPYRRSELNALCRITPDMPEDEVRRRVRAVTFPGAPGAYIEIGGCRFEFRG